MELSEYQNIHDSEDAHWWYLGLRQLVCAEISRNVNNPKANILDAGCGTGGQMKMLPFSNTFGCDFHQLALSFCQQRQLKKICRSSIEALPFKRQCFDAILSLDVLYHAGVEKDEVAIREFQSALKPGGLLLLNLPAYNFLRSHHDRVVHTKHRYTKSEIVQLLKGEGFSIEYCTYRVSFLFPVILMIRLFQKFFLKNSKVDSDVQMPSAVINGILVCLLRLENLLMRFRLPIPFGLSVFCLARKTS